MMSFTEFLLHAQEQQGVNEMASIGKLRNYWQKGSEDVSNRSFVNPEDFGKKLLIRKTLTDKEQKSINKRLKFISKAAKIVMAADDAARAKKSKKKPH